MTKGTLPFDGWMSSYWGKGFNPPSINFMVYSLLVLFICYGAFSLLLESKLQKIVLCISRLGKNTLYIWLYHLLIINFFKNKVPDLLSQNVMIRLMVFCVMVILPVIIKQIICLSVNFYNNNICRTENG